MSVPDHGHCEICQRTVTIGERFCGSAECEEQHQKNIKEKKRQVYLMVGIIVAALILSKLL